MAADERAIITQIKESPHDFVKVAVTDSDGILRGKYLDKDKLLKATETGFGFCNVVFGWDMNDQCYDNTTYTGWHTGYPDAQVELDLATFRTIPWEDDRPFLLGEFVDADGLPLEVCPRQQVKRMVGRAAELGYEAKFGLEFEWFNFAETSQSINDKHFHDLSPITPGMFGYSLIRQSNNQPFFRALLDDLRAYGVPLEGLHTETGPGVLEAGILYSDTVESADRAVLFKTGCKEIGARLGILPTFMARWNNDLPGCSGHHHQSLWQSDGNESAFFDDGGRHGMSKVFEQYLAGQLAYLGDLLPMVAPTVNSYKRLIEGYWAPTKPTWGVDNRTVALRVIPGSPSATRLETRLPGSDVNPYLSVAACLGAGIKGIEEALTLDQAPVEGSAYDTEGPSYARTLDEATERFAQSAVARDLFGDEFVDHFAATRRWEWRQSLQAVTDWEMRRYFEIV
jgi:glutamine synthetase